MKEILNKLTLTIESYKYKKNIKPNAAITISLEYKLKNIEKLHSNSRKLELSKIESLMDEARLYCAHYCHKDATTMIALRSHYDVLVQSTRDDYYKTLFKKIKRLFYEK